MIQENNSEWQYRFLKTGTEYCFGDLSAMVNVVSEILKEQRLALLDRSWEYVVKASREEHGSKEDFIKFVNEHE